MMNLTLQEIANAVDGILLGKDKLISEVCIDTRSLKENALYIAIQGEQFDGHDFIIQAAQQGASALMVNRQLASDLTQIIVKDTRLALGKLAALVRAKIDIKVCGVTGSNGKTTVKEMVAAILSVNAEVLATQGNLNNEIGVPLSLLNLTTEHEFAVIEMGANHQGEIAYSSELARPDVAVINNIGRAHLEGFGSIEGIARAKAEMLTALSITGTAILNCDDDFFPLLTEIAADREIISFGFSEHADVRAENRQLTLQANGFVSQFELVFQQQRLQINLPLAGEHNIKNALAATAACLALDISLAQIKQGLQQMQAVTGRLQWQCTGSGLRIINDTYNANPSSLSVALEILQASQQECWLVLGEFGELGEQAQQLHENMGVEIKQAGVTRLFSTGALTQKTVRAFGEGGQYFAEQTDLISTLLAEIRTDIIVLVKGSRAQKMENVVAALLN